jgi:enamine deaminase RidA (YjgF/YER057c/UK114 family)
VAGPVTAHEIFNPDTLAPPVGFSHAVVPARGKTVYLGGQAGIDSTGGVVGSGLPEQFDTAAANIVTALRAAGGEPDHLVSMQIFVTNVADYRRSAKEIGSVYRKYFGKHYPALALFEVAGLFDPAAKVELWCVAVIPDN